MAVTRRIAILNPVNGIEQFTFPVEKGTHDCHSHYFHAAKYGNGGFTGERCMRHRAGPYKGLPVWFRLDDHEDRLEETIHIVEWLDVAPRTQRIEARFRLAALNPEDCYFSLFFGSEGGIGVYPPQNQAAVVINSLDMDPFEKPYLSVRVVKSGMDIMLVTDDEIYRGPYTRFSRAKLNRNYLFSNIVKHRAIKAGCDDALMLDEYDLVSELSVSNLILVEPDGLVTPSANSSPLNGITKRTIAAISAELFHRPLKEIPVTFDRLRKAQAVFATGTAVGVVRINRIVGDSGRLIYAAANVEATEFVKQLGETYWRLLYGEESGFHPEWFTPVPAEILAMPEGLVHSRS